VADNDRQYARKRPGLAFHVIAFHTRGLNTWKALCGRSVVDPAVDVLPWNEPSCETCLRIQRRRDDPALPEDDGSTSPEESAP
jgi:hypothetical protein